MLKSSEGLFAAQRIVKTKDPHTSYGAAERKVESGTIETDQEKILAVLSKRPDFDEYHPGFCANEISYEITGRPDRGLWYYKVARRLGELKAAGSIEVVCTRTSAIGGMEAQAYRKARK